MIMNPGIKIAALSKLVYQLKCNALPFTTSRDFLITTEWSAVIAELTTPNEMPTMEMGIESRKTPMKNPRVTIEQEKRMRREGRACRIR